MAQYQIINGEGFPALTVDDVTPIEGLGPNPSADPAAHSLLFNDGGWSVPGEEGYSDAAVAEYCTQLGDGYKWSCMGRSPAAENPTVVAERAAHIAKEEQRSAEEEQAVTAAHERAKVLKQQSINDRLFALRDPKAFAKMVAAREMTLRHQAELAEATAFGLDSQAIADLAEIHDREMAKADEAATVV